MKQILVIESSPKGKQSISRQVTQSLVDKCIRELGASNAQIVRRDLVTQPLPHIDGETVGAFFTPPEARTESQKRAIQLSDQLVDELISADVVIIGSPMWNFNIPSALKAWIDHVVRAGRTFAFGAKGPEGLLRGKKTYIVTSSGSVFSSGAFQSYDFQIPYLKTVLGFIGLTEIEVVRAEGTNDPTHQAAVIEKAKKVIEQISI